ncbi:unnamed protein product [Symbiodinium natans]|uniref:Uncharacterized protein n=1 Tax=Symbiodinium natans TaxID=878477 RepID=A0A812IAC8_9DINO|nr:unnamed protein product [Symbiodinium natans]
MAPSTEQGEAEARSARIQARFQQCMGDDSSQRLFTQLDAFRGRLWAEINGVETAAILWWTMSSGFCALAFVWWLGGENWLIGQWVLCGVILVVAGILALGLGPYLPDASAVLDSEDVLWCVVVGAFVTFYSFPQLLLSQNLLQSFSDDVTEAHGSYQGIFWSCVIAMVSVPIFANWHMIITRAWLATFRDYHATTENTINHKIVTLTPGRSSSKAEQQPLVDAKAGQAETWLCISVKIRQPPHSWRKGLQHRRTRPRVFCCYAPSARPKAPFEQCPGPHHG